MVWCCVPFESLDPEIGAKDARGKTVDGLDIQSRDDLVSGKQFLRLCCISLVQCSRVGVVCFSLIQ